MEEKKISDIKELIRSLEYALGYVDYCKTNLKDSIEKLGEPIDQKFLQDLKEVMDKYDKTLKGLVDR